MTTHREDDYEDVITFATIVNGGNKLELFAQLINIGLVDQNHMKPFTLRLVDHEDEDRSTFDITVRVLGIQSGDSSGDVWQLNCRVNHRSLVTAPDWFVYAIVDPLASLEVTFNTRTRKGTFTCRN